jgi:hypothetical protein
MLSGIRNVGQIFVSAMRRHCMCQETFHLISRGCLGTLVSEYILRLFSVLLANVKTYLLLQSCHPSYNCLCLFDRISILLYLKVMKHVFVICVVNGVYRSSNT